MTTSLHLKILFHSIDGAGHLNACIGLAQALANRGHRIIFLMNAGFKAQLEKYGFEVILLVDSPPSSKPSEADVKNVEPAKNPIKAVADQLMSCGLLSGKSSLEKTIALGKSGFLAPFYHKLVTVNPQMEQAIQQVQPDLIIMDHILIPPALPMSGIPFVLLLSGNPVMLFAPKMPPGFSGFPTNSDPSTWVEYQAAFKENFLDLTANFQIQLNAHFNYHSQITPVDSTNREFKLSPYLNVYGFPLELDYQDQVRLSDKFCQVDAYCRVELESFELPNEFKKKSPDDKLIYLSLGSMGSVDVELMKRIVAVLGKTQHKCIISKGPREDEYELPDNCWGEAFLPQTRILPLVDLVITHGGNNTVTETFLFGKPMIVMPLFGDQYDNAQRVHEKAFGVRLDAYAFQEREFIEAIDKLLSDTSLHERLQTAVRRIKTSNSKEKACERIEQLVQKSKK